MDLIMNGQASGSVASRLLATGFNPSVLRPWVGKNGLSYVANTNNGKTVSTPLTNATATLKKDEWKFIDDAVAMVARERLTVVNEIRSRGLVLNINDGMGTTFIESQRIGDITPATISMDPARKSEADRPELDLIGIPLPVIHKDFFFNIREIATSRRKGTNLDTSMAQMAGRKVLEEAEKLVLGTTGSFSYGGGVIYGLTNFPQRLTQSLTLPTANGWTGAALVSQILTMRQKSVDVSRFGPWVLFYSMAWDPYLDTDYSTLKGDMTLRQRIMQTQGIQSMVPVPYLTGFQMVLVQMTSDVIREVIGMDLTTVQWETDGGMVINFKVMAIMVPQLRADIQDSTGVVHGVGA